MVDANGERIPETNIYNVVYASIDIPNLKKASWYATFSNGTCSKAEYKKGTDGCDINTGGIGGTDPSLLASTIISGDKFLSKTKGLHKTNALYAADFNMNNIFNYYLKENYVKSADEMEEITWNFLDDFMGLKQDEWETWSPERKNSTYVIIEPTTLIKYRGEYYWGTQYELSSLAFQNSYNASNANGEGNLVALLGNRMACSSYLTGAIQNNNAVGVNKGNGSYFNGGINYFSDLSSLNYSASSNKTVSQICGTRSNYKASGGVFAPEVLENYGVGVKLLWVGQMSDDLFSCNDVNTNYPSLVGMSEASLNALPTTLSYKNTSNETIKFSRDWYKAECTCYGVTNYYKGKTGTSLTDLTKFQISTIFNNNEASTGYFANYKKELINKKDDNYGSVTIWNSEKYLNELKCPTSSTCSDVKFTDIPNTISSYKFPSCYLYDNKSSYYDSSNSWYLDKAAQRCYDYGYWSCTDYRNYYYFMHQSDGVQCSWRDRNLGYYDWYFGLRTSPYVQTKDLAYNTIKNMCRNLPLFGDANYTTEYVQSHKSDYEKCFGYYNNAKNKSWTLTKYQENGCMPDDAVVAKKYNCTPEYNIGNCLTGESIYYKDTAENLTDDEYWENCVTSDENAYYSIDVHKKASNADINSYYDAALSNRYCKTYCTEELQANFNSEKIYVRAGLNFAWNNHFISGNRTCKTDNIEWTQFKSDVIDYNSKIETAYNTYLSLKAQKATEKHERTADCGCYCSKPCTRQEDGTCTGGCSSEACPTDYYTYSTVTVNGITSDSYGSCSTTTSEKVMDEKVSDALNEYTNIKGDSESAYHDMENCSKWSDDNIYNLSPTVDIIYDDGGKGITSYSYNSKLSGVKMGEKTIYDNTTSDSDCIDTTVDVITSEDCLEKEELDEAELKKKGCQQSNI